VVGTAEAILSIHMQVKCISRHFFSLITLGYGRHPDYWFFFLHVISDSMESRSRQSKTCLSRLRGDQSFEGKGENTLQLLL
jgi:hypothetical protein